MGNYKLAKEEKGGMGLQQGLHYTKAFFALCKALSEKGKSRLQQMAEEDKKCYDSKMPNYKPAEGEKSGKERSVCSFLSDIWHAKAKQSMPDPTVGDAAKQQGHHRNKVSQETHSKNEDLSEAQWITHYIKTLFSEKGKSHLQQMAEKDKKCYDSEMPNYKPAEREQIGKERSVFSSLSNNDHVKAKLLMPHPTVGDAAKQHSSHRDGDKVSQETHSKNEALSARYKAHYVKTLFSEKGKSHLQQMAEKNKKCYDSEMPNYKPAEREKSGKERSVFPSLSNIEHVKAKLLMRDPTVGDAAKQHSRHRDVDNVLQETHSKNEALSAHYKAYYVKDKMESLHGVPSTVLSRTTYQEEFRNVLLNVGNQHYPGHKLILSLAGPMFADTIKQFVLKDEIVSLNIPNTDSAIFYKVLRYINTNDINLHTVTEACRVLTLSEKYQIFGLQQKCHEYINRHFISPEHAIKKFETASTDKLKMDGVRELCMYTFSRATKAVFESASFCEAQLSTVEVIAKMNNLAINCEMDILLAILKWGKAYCRTKNLPVDTNLRTSIEPLLEHIRFLTIPLPVLKNVWKTYSNLMTSQEICALTITILCPGLGVEIPKTLCSLNNPRSVPNSHKVENKQTCNTDGNPQPSNSTAVDASKGTAVKALNVSPLLRVVDPIKSKNNLTGLTAVNFAPSEGKCTSLTATKLASHFQDRSVGMKDVDSKILKGTRTVVSPLKLASASGSTKKKNSSSESDIEEVHVQNYMYYKIIEFKLDDQKEMPGGVRLADVKSVINFSVIEGCVELIGVRMQMRHVTGKQTHNIHIRLEINDKMKFEQVDEKVVTSLFNVFFKKSVHVYMHNRARIVVTVEDLQLKHCCICVLPCFNNCNMKGNRYGIEISSNHQAVNSSVPVLVNGILYRDH